MIEKTRTDSSVAEVVRSVARSQIETDGVTKTVPFNSKLRLPPVELVKLFQTLRHTLTGQQSHIIQFASTYHGEGVNLIGFEWARIAATQFGLRVLFIDTSRLRKNGRDERSKLAAAVVTPLGELIQKGGNLSSAQVALGDTGLVYTTLRRPGDQSSIIFDLDTLGELLRDLQETYDLVVIPSPAITTDVLSLSLAKLADASVLVIEAERTRLPVVQRTLQVMEANGGKVVGAILNRRKFYIPRWIYRWI